MSAALAGCVTVRFTVDAPGISDSPVFESISVKNDIVWGTNNARTEVTLTDRATGALEVRRFSVIDATGGVVWSDTVTGGATSVSPLMRVGVRQTIYAFTSTGTLVDQQPVTISGRRIP